MTTPTPTAPSAELQAAIEELRIAQRRCNDCYPDCENCEACTRRNDGFEFCIAALSQSSEPHSFTCPKCGGHHFGTDDATVEPAVERVVICQTREPGCCNGKGWHGQWWKMKDQINEVGAQSSAAQRAVEVAWLHLKDLREAWRTGALTGRDGRDGERANRNVDAEVALRNLIDPKRLDELVKLTPKDWYALFQQAKIQWDKDHLRPT